MTSPATPELSLRPSTARGDLLLRWARGALSTPTRVGAWVGLAVAALVLGPALRPGYLLWYDMVFVPRLDLSARTLGVDGAVPRAVPNDAMVALLSTLAPGWVVQQALLIAVFVTAGAGVGRLATSRISAAGGAVVATWNPWVGERLAIGHWGFLLGYAFLPWVAGAAADVARGRPRALVRLAVAILAAALSGSTPAVLALILAVCVLLFTPRIAPRPARPWLPWLFLGAWWLAVNAPWWYPYLAFAPHESADPAGVAAFMSRSDTPWGTLGSLMLGGGLWNQASWFAERRAWPASSAALLAVVLLLMVSVWLRSWRRSPIAPGLAAAGVVGMLVSVASAIPVGRELVTVIVITVPGGGLLRDSQKFAALWVLLLASLTAFVADGLLERWRESARPWRPLATALLASSMVIVPVITLPSLAWGGAGRWSSVDYPSGYHQVASQIARSPAGHVAVLPWTLYRRYPWNAHRVMLDPWQRLISRRVVLNDDLPLSERVVRGEDAAARRVTDCIDARLLVADCMKREGIRYVVVQHDQPRGPHPTAPPEGRVMASESNLTLIDLGDVRTTTSLPTRALNTPVPAVRYLGWGVCLVAIVGLLSYALVTRDASGHRARRTALAHKHQDR